MTRPSFVILDDLIERPLGLMRVAGFSPEESGVAGLLVDVSVAEVLIEFPFEFLPDTLAGIEEDDVDLTSGVALRDGCVLNFRGKNPLRCL